MSDAFATLSGHVLPPIGGIVAKILKQTKSQNPNTDTKLLTCLFATHHAQQYHKGIHPRRTTALVFFQEKVGGNKFQCLNVVRLIDIYTSVCDCGRHVWIGVCRARPAHIDGGNGFPICLFAHALASNNVTDVLLKCLTLMFALLRAQRGGPYPFRITLFCF